MTSERQKTGTTLNRRQFITGVMKTACGVGLFGLGLGLYSQRASSLPAWAIRPPGAVPEDDFNGACIRCGLCVRDCPFDMLHLAELGQDIPTGTPYFIAREAGCEMCEDIPCVAACPTNALDHALTDIRKADMGLAVLIDQENCIAFQGLRCEVCFNVCPVRGEAITLDMQHNERSGKHARFIPVVHSAHCTGCGKCEEVCILDEAAIKVLPRHLAKGQLGAHYRLGWEQKRQAGEALVTPDAEHRYNLPEGMGYEHGGRGLIEEAAPGQPASPVPDNPLDSLNRKGAL
ncbi:ferredoxin-type protein NapG [Thiocystis violacea]|uniref:ferredoxin-type protein NapG n=1 Tax=Thiocystis violacea TaxID=13725 RepID=UPI00190437BB|nr:ferredoxin-type protein NapG [Thiocystis violacea]MBK1716757.1 ferredoxin-type protein NapG [Thiocystis violacea]